MGGSPEATDSFFQVLVLNRLFTTGSGQASQAKAQECKGTWLGHRAIVATTTGCGAKAIKINITGVTTLSAVRGQQGD